MADDNYDLDPEMVRLLMSEVATNMALCRVALMHADRLPRHAMVALFCCLVDLNGACLQVRAAAHEQGALRQ